MEIIIAKDNSKSNKTKSSFSISLEPAKYVRCIVGWSTNTKYGRLLSFQHLQYTFNDLKRAYYQ